jgi:hypothetical protein
VVTASVRGLQWLTSRFVAWQTQGLDARDDRRGFHAKQRGSTVSAEDFSVGLRQGGRQVLTLASFEFGAGQDEGCICRCCQNSRRSVGGLEPFELQKTALGEDDGALDGVLQFADIARPLVRSELAHGGLGNSRCGTIHSLGGLLHKMRGEGRDVVAALAKRREFNREDAQAIVKVLAEAACIDFMFQVAIGGGDDANVDLAATGIADTFQFLLLQDAQQLCLHREWYFGDFVEKQRAAVSQFEAAKLILDRAGERAFHVTEKLALEQAVGYCTTIYLDEGMALSRTVVVDGPGDELLAGAAFSCDEHCGRCGGNELNLLHHCLHGRTSTDDVSEVVLATNFFPQITSNGPDVHVVLAMANDTMLRSAPHGNAPASIELGALKGNQGDQDYPLPANTDVTRYSLVAIYCERFRAIFGTASLQPF